MNPLKELLELAQEKEDLDEKILFKVAEARAEKHSWQAIANVIGGTKQAAQQRYGKVIDRDQLLEQGKYECSCGWTLVYPGWESREALGDITEHEEFHQREDDREEYITASDMPMTDEEEEREALGEFALQQLADETSKNLDVPAPAKRKESRATAATHAETVEWAKVWMQTNLDKKSDGEQLADEASKKVDADAPAKVADPIHQGITDTSGDVIDWTGRRQFKNPKKCPFCEQRTHYASRPQHWWIYPSCTLTDADYTAHDKAAAK